MAADGTRTARGTARDRILDTALTLFYAHGVRAVGVDRIIEESGVAKATFYKHFPAKDKLALAYVEKIDDVCSGQLHGAAEAAGPDPAAQLVGVFDALTGMCHAEGFRGCAFVNAAAEAEPGSPVHALAVRHKRDVRAWMRRLAERAGAADPDQLARTLTLLMDGVLAGGALAPDPLAAQAAKTAARLLVQASVAAAAEAGAPTEAAPAVASEAGAEAAADAAARLVRTR
ncbi:TetR/AcrR family transcriptional regulator [Streptomyces sp. V4-01]|uniref:TetR/AcrR family transcriptional regulator n=1 Tax=Actinacidiphila polyblastidii TaxID=3110430 RepID=A0ABU7PHE2_9ACTN|nr:TetR/AcrR family transcriptional regulator [Streptomyces sp. V4-01]